MLELLRARPTRRCAPCYVVAQRRVATRSSTRSSSSRARLRTVPPERLDRDGAQRRAARRARAAPHRCAPPTSTTCSPRRTRSSSRSTVSPIRATSARCCASAETAGVTGIVVPRHRSARVTPVGREGRGRRDRVRADRDRRRHPRVRSNARRAPACWSVGLDERGEQSARRPRRSPTNRSCSCSAPKGAASRGSRASAATCSRASRCTASSRRSTSRPRPRSRATRSRAAAASGQHGVACRVLAGLAQLAEQLICNQQVVGSIPTPGSACTCRVSAARRRPRNRKCL